MSGRLGGVKVVILPNKEHPVLPGRFFDGAKAIGTRPGRTTRTGATRAIPQGGHSGQPPAD